MRLLFYFFFLLQRIIFGVLVVALNNKTQEREKKLGLVISLVILFFAVILSHFLGAALFCFIMSICSHFLDHLHHCRAVYILDFSCYFALFLAKWIYSFWTWDGKSWHFRDCANLSAYYIRACVCYFGDDSWHQETAEGIQKETHFHWSESNRS